MFFGPLGPMWPWGPWGHLIIYLRISSGAIRGLILRLASVDILVNSSGFAMFFAYPAVSGQASRQASGGENSSHFVVFFAFGG